jgi:glycosyltransferase involved in cell wall biosynthesis
MDVTPALSARRVRVLINAIHARSGGGVTYIHNILPLLAEDTRLELHIFLMKEQMALFHPIPQNVRVHLFPEITDAAAFVAWEQIAIPLLARVMKSDLIFSPANVGCLLSNRNIILLRNALSVARVEPRIGRWFYWASLGLATMLSVLRSRQVLAVSSHAVRSLTFGLLRRPYKNIAVVYHGISPRYLPDPGVRREKFILIVADIYVQKNLLNFFRAAADICRRRPEVRIKVAGTPIDKWYYNQTRFLIEREGIADKVDFLGRLPSGELLDLYRRCLMLAFPSTAETFGNPLVEAMACGTPIACSNTSAMPEIVSDAAMFFDPFDVRSIADACLRVIDSDELRASLSARGLARAKHFSWIKSARQTADALVQAVAAPA